MYPVTEPYQEGYFEVSTLHSVYYMQCGNPEGKPVVFVHGGPGAGVSPANTVFFDPKVYRIVLFSQRGAWKSKPVGEIRGNCTWDLILDMDRLREKLGIEKWVVFGGSWGSTLSLIYAQAYPERCVALILRGIWLLDINREKKWFGKDGRGMIFPEAWDRFETFIPEEERSDIWAAYEKRIMNDDNKEEQRAACKEWNLWEYQISTLSPDPEIWSKVEDHDFSLAHAKLEMHYMSNEGWLEPRQILDNVDKIRNIPCITVHGRYDVVCPPINAWELQKAWPEMELIWSEDAGHSAREPTTTKHLVEATDKFAKLDF